MTFPGTPVLATVPRGTTWVRVYDTRYYREGGQLRAYGPQPRGRWDHFPPGLPRPSSTLGVLYLADTLLTAVAEVYGDLRRVRPTPHQRLAVLAQRRAVRLADVRGAAAVELGVPAGALRTRDRDLTQRVARDLHEQTRAEGVLFESWHTGAPCACLWERGADALELVDDRALVDPHVAADVAVAAQALHYDLEL